MCIVALLVLLGGLFTGVALAGPDFDRDIIKVREAYIKATDGNKRAWRKALKTIRVMENRYQGQPTVMAYKGGVLSLRGKDIGKTGMSRMRDTEEGLNLIDRSLAILDQGHTDLLAESEARLVAAFVFINLPDSIFHRLKEGEHWVDYLLEHPQSQRFPQGMQAAIYLAAATAAEKRNNTQRQRHYLQLALKTDPEGKSGHDAAQLLAAMEP